MRKYAKRYVASVLNRLPQQRYFYYEQPHSTEIIYFIDSSGHAVVLLEFARHPRRHALARGTYTDRKAYAIVEHLKKKYGLLPCCPEIEVVRSGDGPFECALVPGAWDGVVHH